MWDAILGHYIYAKTNQQCRTEDCLASIWNYLPQEFTDKATPAISIFWQRLLLWPNKGQTMRHMGMTENDWCGVMISTWQTKAYSVTRPRNLRELRRVSGSECWTQAGYTARQPAIDDVSVFTAVNSRARLRWIEVPLRTVADLVWASNRKTGITDPWASNTSTERQTTDVSSGRLRPPSLWVTLWGYWLSWCATSGDWVDVGGWHGYSAMASLAVVFVRERNYFVVLFLFSDSIRHACKMA